MREIPLAAMTDAAGATYDLVVRTLLVRLEAPASAADPRPTADTTEH